MRTTFARSVKSWAVVFWLFLLVTGWAQETLPAWNSENVKAWWAQNSTPAQWPKAADDLQAQLEASYKQNGPAVYSDADFRAWLDHLLWLRLGLNSSHLADPQNLQNFVALGSDELLSHQLVEKLDPHDVPQAALDILLKLANANLADLHEYASLGVAFALVFDAPFPDFWPHAQVKQAAVPIGDLDVVRRFNFYVAANRDKKLESNLTQLRFEDLKYLVDSEVKLPELAYAQENRIPYSHFEDAFFSIKYNFKRITPQNQVFDWNFPTYLLADIEKNGGICVDQAYYATLLGKGRGIPTIYFMGQGTDGGHAWFGYLTRSGKWELDCGRYSNGNYLKGYALDPQTWQIVKDTTLQQLAKNGGTNPGYGPAMTALAWARLRGDDPICRQIFDEARTLMPECAQTWQIESDFLEKTNAPLDDRKTFYQNWINQFSSFTDMKVEGQQRLLAALKKAGDSGADDVQRDIVLQNRSEGVDLGVEESFTAIADKLKDQDWDGAKLDFERSVLDFKEGGGGTFFYEIVRPYIQGCVKGQQFAQAENGLHFVEERMPLNPDSIVAIDFGKLQKEVKDAADSASAQ